MSKLTHAMELAEAQILGFSHCLGGFSLEELVDSMGLTREEWEIIKKETPVQAYLSQDYGDEIEDYLNKQEKVSKEKK